MAKYSIAVLCLLGLLTPTASGKFTIVNRDSSQNLHQLSKTSTAIIGKPMKLHLDRVYQVSGNSFVQSKEDNLDGLELGAMAEYIVDAEKKQQEQTEKQSLTQACPAEVVVAASSGCTAGCPAEQGDAEEAEEIYKSTSRMKKMLEKKEQKDQQKELLKESKEKVEKAGAEINDEAAKKKSRADTEQKLSSIKKAGKKAAKKVKTVQKIEEIKEEKKKVDKIAEESQKESKRQEKEKKIKKILQDSEENIEKKEKESEEKLEEDNKKVEAATVNLKKNKDTTTTTAASVSAPASDAKVEKSVEQAPEQSTTEKVHNIGGPPSSRKVHDIGGPPSSRKVHNIGGPPSSKKESSASDDEDKDGDTINKEEEQKELDEKNSINKALKTEGEKEAKLIKKQEKKNKEESDKKKALKQELKKDPYKQSTDVLNGSPFVNIRAGGDTGSIKSTIAETSDNGERKYTQKQFDVAVRMASHDSAELAVNKLKEIQTVDKQEKKELKKEIKTAEKGTYTKTTSSTKAVKSAIKEAVIKISGNKKIADPKLSDEYEKNQHKHSGPLYHAVSGIVEDPYNNGLNAATTAGISIAKQILDGSSQHIDDRMNQMSMTMRNMPPGITPAGFLDDESDD